jgi:hypothetical protein
MPRLPIVKRALEGMLTIGATPDESEVRRSGRRVFMLAFVLATLLSLPAAIDRFDAGYTWVGVVDVVTLAIPVLLLVVIATRPTSYVPTLHMMFLVITAGLVLDTAMFGGLLPSGSLVIFGLGVALAALLAIDLRAGLVWFGVFAFSVAHAVAVPHWVDPIYTLDDPTSNAAFNLIATGIVTMAVMIYFIRQRDRYQRRSDDLLHAICPIRSRLGSRTRLARSRTTWRLPPCCSRMWSTSRRCRPPCRQPSSSACSMSSSPSSMAS